jgi:Predicted membrane protein (DUF2157)
VPLTPGGDARQSASAVGVWHPDSMDQPAGRPSRLAAELAVLTESKVLSPELADRLWQAALADAQVAPTPEPATDDRGRTGNPGLLDVLGYVGGALLLGALLFLGGALWRDLSRLARDLVALAALLIAAAGGAALWRSRTRRPLAGVLLALACVAAGFAYHQVFDDQEGVVSSAVVVVGAALLTVLLGSAACLLAGWVGAMVFVVALVSKLTEPEHDHMAVLVAAGFGVVAVLLGLAGSWRHRTAAWVLAGLSGWAASAALLSTQPPIRGAYLCLIVATLVAGALFAAFVRFRSSWYAVVGCLIMLSMWPVGLQRILASAVGVALGLVVAGGLLIAAAVALGQRQRRAAPPIDHPPRASE